MGIRNLARNTVVGAAAVALTTSAASSQGVTYTNSWSFDQSSCAGSSCGYGGYGVHWSWVTESTYLLTITQNGFGQGGDRNSGGDQNSGVASSDDPGPWWGVGNDGTTHGHGNDGGCTHRCDHDDPPPTGLGPTNDIITNDVITNDVSFNNLA